VIRGSQFEDFMSLRFKIIIPILTFVLLILSGASAVTYKHTSENLLKSLQDIMRSEASFLCRSIQVLSENSVANISDIASSDAVVNFLQNGVFDRTFFTFPDFP
jgi:hypothetical protein